MSEQPGNREATGARPPSHSAAPANSRATETQFFQLADKIPLVLWIREASSGQLQYVSPAYESVWGRPASELKTDATGFLPAVHPDDLARVQAGLGLPAEPATMEFRIIRPDDSVRWIRSVRYPVLNQKGAVARVIGIAEDITDRKQTEEVTRLQHSALEASANGIMIADCAGTILWVNQAFTRLTGYSPEEAKGQNPKILKSGKQDPAVYQELWLTIMSGKCWHGEMCNKRKDGSLYQEEMTITPCRDANGEITNFIAIKQDISERKELQARFFRGQRMETIGTLASGIAHDLNNVLAPVMMSATLLREAETVEEREKVLSILEGSVRHGSELIKQVLAFARGVANHPMLLQPVHLVKEFRRMVENVFPKSIQINVDYLADVHPIVADPTQVHQVLMNLCVNARDAMPEGGRLTISVYNTVVDEAYAAMDGKPGAHVVFAVADTGAGINPEIRGKIFEPFFTTKSGGSGSGFGLTTTLAIVNAHRGFIHVYSEPGKGSTFKVHLPATVAAKATGDHSQSAALLRGNGEWVLVADDEDSVRTVCKRVLERFGYRVLIAHNGKEALAVYAQNSDKVQVVIMDMMMPVMDGAAAIKELKAAHANAAIIAASGLGPEMAWPGRDGGAGFLQKPWTAEALLNAVANALAGRADRSQGVARESSQKI